MSSCLRRLVEFNFELFGQGVQIGDLHLLELREVHLFSQQGIFACACFSHIDFDAGGFGWRPPCVGPFRLPEEGSGRGGAQAPARPGSQVFGDRMRNGERPKSGLTP